MIDSLKEKIRSENYLPLWLMTGYWVLIGLLEFLKIFASSAGDLSNFNWGININFVLIYSFAWILITYPIYKAFQLFLEKNKTWKIVSQIFFSVFFSLLHTLILGILFSYFLYSPAKHGDSFFTFYTGRMSANFLRSMVMSFSVYWVMILILFTLDYYRKFKEKSSQAIKLESSLTQAQLQTLRMQIQPHFLFNAHNTIAMLIRTKRFDYAVSMISKLSELIRTSITIDDNQSTTLEKELELIEMYLEIEKERFEKSFEYTICLQNETKNLRVPNLILLPVVENSFKHGLSKIIGKRFLRIESQLKNDHLLITVFNTGPHLSEDFKIGSCSGIGISNTLERLNQIYGDKSSFNVFNAEGGVTAEIIIPLDKKYL